MAQCSVTRDSVAATLPCSEPLTQGNLNDSRSMATGEWCEKVRRLVVK